MESQLWYLGWKKELQSAISLLDGSLKLVFLHHLLLCNTLKDTTTKGNIRRTAEKIAQQVFVASCVVGWLGVEGLG